MKMKLHLEEVVNFPVYLPALFYCNKSNVVRAGEENILDTEPELMYVIDTRGEIKLEALTAGVNEIDISNWRLFTLPPDNMYDLLTYTAGNRDLNWTLECLTEIPLTNEFEITVNVMGSNIEVHGTDYMGEFPYRGTVVEAFRTNYPSRGHRLDN